MKVLLLCLIVVQGLLAQTQFVYDYTIKDTKKDFYNTEEMILYIDKNQSIFKSLTGILYLKDFNKQRALDGDIRLTKKKSIINSFFILNTKSNQGHYYEYLAGHSGKVQLETDNLEWELVKETKKNGEKPLNGAKVKMYDRTWIAWYDSSLPIQDVPYMFKGLPGLIVELYDEEKHHHFVFKGVYEPKLTLSDLHYNEINSFKTYKIDKYKTIVSDLLKDSYGNYNRFSSLKLPHMTSQQIETYNFRKAREYQSILFKDL